MVEWSQNYVNSTIYIRLAMKIIFYFIFLITAPLVYIFILIKDMYNIFYFKKKYAHTQYEPIVILDNILYWHNENINIDSIKIILYRKSFNEEYAFFYLLKDESIYTIFENQNIYQKRMHLVKKTKAIHLREYLEVKNLIVFPSMWLMRPVGLMGCNLTGGFKNSDFITLAGDSKQIFIYQGLDCDPSNLSMALIDIKSFNLKNDIFIKIMPTIYLKKYKSAYQIYILDRKLTLGKGYMFLPWSKGEFLFEEIIYFKYIEEIKEEIINYFLTHDTRMVISTKNCRIRNNP